MMARGAQGEKHGWKQVMDIGKPVQAKEAKEAKGQLLTVLVQREKAVVLEKDVRDTRVILEASLVGRDNFIEPGSQWIKKVRDEEDAEAKLPGVTGSDRLGNKYSTWWQCWSG